MTQFLGGNKQNFAKYPWQSSPRTTFAEKNGEISQIYEHNGCKIHRFNKLVNSKNSKKHRFGKLLVRDCWKTSMSLMRAW